VDRGPGIEAVIQVVIGPVLDTGADPGVQVSLEPFDGSGCAFGDFASQFGLDPSRVSISDWSMISILSKGLAAAAAAADHIITQVRGPRANCIF
jgi:hypothetical protein